MIKTPLSVVRVAAFCLPLALVASCGSGSQAGQGSEIHLNPDAVAQAVPSNGTSSIANEEFTIEVRSASGTSQVGIDVSIDSPGILSFVDTSVTPHTYTPMGAAGNTYIVNTGGNGVYTVAVSITSGIGASGDVTILSAWSGSAYNRVNITYTCFDNAIGPVPNTCP